MSRLTGLHDEQFDVAVIGGGIIGCGIARDAALRGLRVALFEQRDFGSGTTSASTRIIHGGLRYLEMFDFGLVRMDLRERETLLRIAPHLVKPLEFLIPFFTGDRISSLKLRAGLALYDALSYGKTLPSRRWLSPEAARQADAALDRPDVRGAASYYDARADLPERLALENAIDAERHGARILNYCTATALHRTGDRVTGLRVRDVLDGDEADVRARLVVNATGAWFDAVTSELTASRVNVIRTTKGIHLVCRPLATRALVLFSRVDGRLLFAIPRAGLTWIGTTDTDYAGDPADARATRADVQYLLDSVRNVFPDLRIDDVLYTTAGVRALVRKPGKESSVSRMHKIVDGAPLAPEGMISVLGGKITGYRAIAEEVTDHVCRRLGASNRPSITAQTPLPGARDAAAVSGASHPHLLDVYGARAHEVLAVAASRPELEQPLSPKYPNLAAEAAFSARHEHCVRLSDFLRRRTLLGASDDQGWAAARPAAVVLARELGWSEARTDEEIADYQADIASTVSFRNE